jgi:hypothetical protein
MFKKRVSYLYRTAQPSTLAVFPPWGIKQELVVQDLPTTKVEKENTTHAMKLAFFLIYFIL